MRALWVLVLLSALGCSETKDEPAAGSGGASTGGASGASGAGASGGGGAGAGCDATTPGCVNHVSGKVIDDSGAGVPQLLMSVCGAVCYFGETDGSGNFDVGVGAVIDPLQYSTLPHGRPDYTSFYYLLPTGAQDQVNVGELLVLPLPSGGQTLVVKSDSAGAPAQTVTHGGVTLEVPQDVVVKIDVEDIALGDPGKTFRALQIPSQHQAAFVAPSESVLALYQLTPFETSFRDANGKPAKVRLSFEAPAGLGAGETVEVLALGSYLFLDWVSPARFEPVATATVTSDGTRVEMDPGQGIEYLTWIALRKKP
ncbi:MAG: hypothetical protein R3B13_39500 [Polyangiaceae bacterium]